MSLENLQLPPIVIQQLFSHSLVALANEKKSPKTVSKSLSSLGSNNKGILIIISSKEDLYLPDDQLNFLLGILSACNLTMEDVGILNIQRNPAATYQLLESEFKCGKLILFGVSPAQIGLPLDFPAYQVQRFNNQVYLTAPELLNLQNDKVEKTKLWNCLKQIFSI